MTPPPPFLAWSSDLELGAPQLDNEHQALLVQVNRFAALAHDEQGDEAMAAMALLIAAARRHFANEEALMMQSGYPDTVLHQEQHAELLASMERLWQRLQRDRSVTDRTRALGFLRDWFVIHIVHSDSQIVPCLVAAGSP